MTVTTSTATDRSALRGIRVGITAPQGGEYARRLEHALKKRGAIVIGTASITTRSLRSSTSRSYDDDEETLLLECVRGQSWLDYAPIDIRRAVSSDACGRLRESLARDKWREAAWRAVGLVDGDDGDGGDGDRHHHYNHILFTSRKGVTEFLEAWRELQGGGGGGGLHSVAGPLKVKKKTTKAFMLWALGSDASPLLESPQWKDHVMTPSEATPQGLADSVISHIASLPVSARTNVSHQLVVPVPVVQGLDEPDVIPEFLSTLRDSSRLLPAASVMGQNQRPISISALPAYVTQSVVASPQAFEAIMASWGSAEAILFTSVGEYLALERFVKQSTQTMAKTASNKNDNDNACSPWHRDVWAETLDRVLIAAMGYNTATGIERSLGDYRTKTSVDFVGQNAKSFDDLVGQFEAFLSASPLAFPDQRRKQ